MKHQCAILNYMFNHKKMDNEFFENEKKRVINEEMYDVCKNGLIIK